MQVRTNVKAWSTLNHNETLVREGAKGVEVKTNVNRWGWLNHNETLVRDLA